MYQAIRFTENPLIYPEMGEKLGRNINGPSVIKVPDWVSGRLGRYYLYFAHHSGTFIRMAYADDIRGPWRLYHGGVLNLEDTCCSSHIASPDAHILEERREIVMYFHGCVPEGQRSFRAVSSDGLHFRAFPDVLGPFYFRVFKHGGAWYAIAKTPDAPGGGVLLRSPDGIAKFERGPDILPNQRHVAVLRKSEDLVHVFFSRGEDCPERIFVSSMRLADDWKTWRPAEPQEVLRPETKVEGGHLPVYPSRFGPVGEPVHELRDPAVYEEDGRLYLLYTGAGESNVCGAELVEESAVL